MTANVKKNYFSKTLTGGGKASNAFKKRDVLFERCLMNDREKNHASNIFISQIFISQFFLHSLKAHYFSLLVVTLLIFKNLDFF